MNNIFSLEIGKKFPIPHNKNGEGITLETYPPGIFLRMYYQNPTSQEIYSIKNDTLTLFFSYIKPILNCTIQVEDNFWGDAPYFAPLYNEKLSTAEMNPHVVYVCLIDADTEILKSFRIIELPSEITSFICKVQTEQYSDTISESEYDELLNYMHQKLSISDLAATSDAAVVILRNNTMKSYMRKNGKIVQL